MKVFKKDGKYYKISIDKNLYNNIYDPPDPNFKMSTKERKKLSNIFKKEYEEQIKKIREEYGT